MPQAEPNSSPQNQLGGRVRVTSSLTVRRMAGHSANSRLGPMSYLMSCEQKKPATPESGDSKYGLTLDVKGYWGTELSWAGTTVSAAFWMAV